MPKTWVVRVYDADDDSVIIGEWRIENRTEDEAAREASADVEAEFPHAGDWTLAQDEPDLWEHAAEDYKWQREGEIMRELRDA